MKVSQKKVDEQNITVTIVLEKEDWAEPRKKKLNEFRRTADIKGFRKGMAPMSLIERVHGGQALAEVLNTQVSEQIQNFIESKKLDIIGEPLPSEKEEKNDWDNPDTFSFSFDIALAPKVEFTVSADDKIPYYQVNVTAKALKDYKASLLKQYGTLETGKTAKAEDFVIADFETGDRKVEAAYVAVRSIQDEEIKKSFVGLKAGDVRDIDIVKTFANETDRAAMFKVKKEELSELPADWKMTVKEIKTFVDAKPVQATFDQIFGKGTVKTEEEFDAKVKERLEAEYVQEGDFRFSTDAKEYFLKKTKISLPDAFMKRWIFTANDGKFTKEQIEQEYDLFAKDFRWDMIRNKIIKDQQLKTSREDLLAEAKKLAAYQFAMYGMNQVPEETLTQFAERTLADEQQARRIFEKVQDDHALAFIRKTVTLDTKKVSIEKMRELTA